MFSIKASTVPETDGGWFPSDPVGISPHFQKMLPAACLTKITLRYKVIGIDRGPCMKALLRIAAVLSFGFCVAAGFTLLARVPSESFLLVAAGLFLVGALLLFAAERFGHKG